MIRFLRIMSQFWKHRISIICLCCFYRFTICQPPNLVIGVDGSMLSQYFDAVKVVRIVAVAEGVTIWENVVVISSCIFEKRIRVEFAKQFAKTVSKYFERKKLSKDFDHCVPTRFLLFETRAINDEVSQPSDDGFFCYINFIFYCFGLLFFWTDFILID